MKILVADRISPLGVEFLKKQDGFTVVEAYGSSPEEVIQNAKMLLRLSYGVILKSPASVMEAAPCSRQWVGQV